MASRSTLAATRDAELLEAIGEGLLLVYGPAECDPADGPFLHVAIDCGMMFCPDGSDAGASLLADAAAFLRMARRELAEVEHKLRRRLAQRVA